MLLRRIDTDTGLFIEDVICEAHPKQISGIPDPAYIETPVPPGAGFQWPRWNGTAWEEGGTPQQPHDLAEVQTAPVTPEAFAALENAVYGILDTLEALL